MGRELRRRYALIAGLLLGIGLWTKPTMGAFILGVGAAADRSTWCACASTCARWQPRLQVALLTGIAALPLGGVWYLRNLLLGLPPLVFPPAFWQTLAQRSGGEFGWLLAALIAWAIYLYCRYPRYDWRLGGSRDWRWCCWRWCRRSSSPRRLTVHRVRAAGGGAGRAGGRRCGAWRAICGTTICAPIAATVGWGLALALPYFVTWFYSYSYHYRLSFAIVPLLILPTAAILARLVHAGAHRRRACGAWLIWR